MFYSILFLIGRLIYGAYFLHSGIKHFTNTNMLTGYAASKGVVQSKLAVYVTGLLMIFGGLGILLVAYIPYAVAMLAVFLIPVSLIMHNYWKDTDANTKMSNMINFNKNMALLGADLMFLVIPTPWMWGL